MPPIDPHAPANHPRHPSQQPARQRARMDRVLRQEQADLDAYEELAATHLTPAESDLRDAALAGDLPDGDQPALPTMGELQARVDALVDYADAREAAREDGQADADAYADAPRIVDAFGVEHALVLSEDGSEAHWEPVPRTYEDMTIAELKALLSDRQLTVGGNKPELITRLTEDDDRRAAEQAAAEAAE